MDSLLVPLDGSPLAERALSVALGLARRAGARLEIVVVNEPRPVVHEGADTVTVRPEIDTRLADALRHYADEVRQRVSRGGAPPVEARVLEGPAATTLAAYAQATGPDLMVVSSHGQTGGRPMWLGSVTDALARIAPASVLVVPTHEQAAPQQESLTRALLALDGTRASETVIHTAGSILGYRGTEYILMHAIQPLHPLVHAVAGDEEYQRDLTEQRRTIERYLSAVAAGLQVRGSEVRHDVRVDQHRAQAVLASAAEHDVDLIALATHVRGKLGRLLLGSVADKVLRASPVPVLLCARGTEDEATEPGEVFPLPA